MELESILTSIKKLLGIAEDDTYFDSDIIMHINSVFMLLNQLGVGPKECFAIEDKSAYWEDFLGDDLPKLHMVKTYMYMKVRVLFDPPSSSTHMSALTQSISEFEWRLALQSEQNT